MRGTPDNPKRPPWVAASTASAAASGRIAVPALPRNRRPRARAAGRRGRRRAALPPWLECRCSRASAARRASPACRRTAAGRAPAVVPAASPASNSTRLEMLLEPAGARVPEAPRSGGRSRWGMAYIMRAVARSPAGVPIFASRLRPSPQRGPRTRSVQRLAVAGLHHQFQCIERVAEARRLFQHFFAVGEQDVAPHRRVAGCDACEVAKTRTGQRQKSRPGAGGHGAEIGEGQQVRQVAHRGEGRVVVLGRHLQHLRADRRPRRRWPSAPAPAWSAAAVSGSPGGRCTARHRHAGCPSASLPAMGCAARSWPRARAAHGVRHRPRLAWCCPRP